MFLLFFSCSVGSAHLWDVLQLFLSLVAAANLKRFTDIVMPAILRIQGVGLNRKSKLTQNAKVVVLTRLGMPKV